MIALMIIAKYGRMEIMNPMETKKAQLSSNTSQIAKFIA